MEQDKKAKLKETPVIDSLLTAVMAFGLICTAVSLFDPEVESPAEYVLICVAFLVCPPLSAAVVLLRHWWRQRSARLE